MNLLSIFPMDYVLSYFGSSTIEQNWKKNSNSEQKIIN